MAIITDNLERYFSGIASPALANPADMDEGLLRLKQQIQEAMIGADPELLRELQGSAAELAILMQAPNSPDKALRFQALSETVRQRATAAAYEASAKTVTAFSVSYDIALSLEQEARIRRAAAMSMANDMENFLSEIFMDDSVPKEFKSEWSKETATILRATPEGRATAEQWDALPVETREATLRVTVQGQERVSAMRKDPKFDDYRRVFRMIESDQMFKSERGLALISRIERGEVTAEDALTEARGIRRNTALRAERFEAGLISSLSTDERGALERSGILRGGDVDMLKLLEANEALGDNWWKERYAPYRGRPRSEWPSGLADELAIREAANKVVMVTGMRNLVDIGQTLERAERRQGITPELAAQQELYLTIFNEGGAATKEERIEAMIRFQSALDEAKTGFSTLTPTQQRRMADQMIQQIDKDPEKFRRAGVSDTQLFEQAELAVIHKSTRATGPAEKKNPNELASNPEVAPETGNIPSAPVTAEPVLVPVTAITASRPELEGRNGPIDNFFTNKLEAAIQNALAGLSTQVIAEKTGNALGVHNEGDLNNRSVNEFENALNAGGYKNVAQLDTDKSGTLSLDEIVHGLNNPKAADTSRGR